LPPQSQDGLLTFAVMPGFDPGIQSRKLPDGRIKSGHNGATEGYPLRGLV
jgi:hypothetical protein